MIILTEFRGATALLLAENTIEIAQIIEPAAIADLRNRIGTVDEHPAGIAQSHVDDIIRQVTACMQLEEATEGAGTHAGDIGHVVETDLVHVVLTDVILHLQHPTAVA